MRRAGLGRKTRQYNPADRGAQTMEQWAGAVASLHGNGTMELADAVAIIRATPSEDRSRFAREIWRVRRQRYGSSGREEAPF